MGRRLASERYDEKGSDMNLKNLNFKYALVNIGYMLLISGSLGFAFNYLSQVGFEPGVIGTVMSVVSLAGVFLGPIAGDLVDRSQKITQKLFIRTRRYSSIRIIFNIISPFLSVSRSA